MQSLKVEEKVEAEVLGMKDHGAEILSELLLSTERLERHLKLRVICTVALIQSLYNRNWNEHDENLVRFVFLNLNHFGSNGTFGNQ